MSEWKTIDSPTWKEILKHRFFIAFNKDLYIEEILNEIAKTISEQDQKLEASQEALGKTFNKLADNQQKLKTGSRMLDEWEKSTTHPDATLVNIRNLKHVLIGDKTQKEKTIVTCKFCKSECIEIQDEKDEHLFTIICPNCEKELLCDSAQNTDYVQKEEKK